MTKKSTSVSIEPWKLEQLSKMGLSLTRIVDNAVDSIVTGEMEDVAVSAQISMMEQEIADLRQEIFSTEHRLVLARQRLLNLQDRRSTIEIEWERAKVTSRVARLMRKLNFVIIGSRYHLPTIRIAGSDIIDELESLVNGFNIESHVDRLKYVMDS